MLELNLFGIPKLCWEGKSLPLPSPKNLAILSYLALRDESDGKPANVRFVLHKLRETPGSESWLETNETFVCVKAVTDVKRFETAVHDERYREALEIHPSGETLLKGLELNDAEEFMNWLDLERSRLGQLYLETLQGRTSELEKANKTDEALKLARQLLEQDKLNENVHRAIMRLEHKRGNTEAALAQFETLRNILKEELDVEPLEDTLKLLRDIEGGNASSVKNALLLTSAKAIPARPEHLFGRDNLLKDVEAHLESKNRVLLHGFGGMGKTALATSVVAQWLEQNKTPVLWLQAGNDDTTILFDAIARAFDAQQTLSQSKDAAKTIRDLLTKNKISLFVLDDVWNAYALSKVMEAIPETIPLLVTSRQRYPNLTRVDVGRLGRGAALELLSHFADLPPAVLESEMNALCELLGDHAFALRIAGITLAVDGLTPQQLFERISNAPHTLKTPLEFSEAGRESVAALLTASLTALSEEAYEAFMGFGVLFTTSCTAELLALCTRRSEEETEEALINLQRRGLADRSSEAGSDVITYRLHDLAYSFAKANNHFRLSTAQRACQVFLEKHQHDFNVLDAEITNVLGATEAARDWDNDALFVEMMRMLVVGNSYYTARGHGPRSLELLKVSVDVSRSLEKLETAHYLATKLGDVYREFYNEAEKALPAYELALELARELHDYHREASLLSLIGITRFSQGKSDAGDYLDQAYALAKSQRDDLALGQILQHKSYLAGVSGAFHVALHLARETIEVAERLTHRAEVDKARVRYLLFFGLLNSGVAEQRLGTLADAKKHFNQALEVALESDNKVWAAYTLQEIGEMYHHANERELAQEHYSKALALYQQNNAKADREVLIELMKTENYAVTEDSTTRFPTPRLANALQTPTTYSFCEGEKPFERSQ
jgi:DNA-binding SARP family transcriptional activator